MDAAPVLLADIGGTNARFALARLDPTVLDRDSIRTYAVADFPSLADAAAHYRDETGTHVARAVMAVAGRVEGDTARLTNHPWVISASRVREALGLESLHLVNDFVAQSMAIRLLQPDDVVPIGASVPQNFFAVSTASSIAPSGGIGVSAVVTSGCRSSSVAVRRIARSSGAMRSRLQPVAWSAMASSSSSWKSSVACASPRV